MRHHPTLPHRHLDIRNAIVMLERSIKGVSNKLDRHEKREMQSSTSTTGSLNLIQGSIRDIGGGVQVVARQLAVMEERLLSLEALIQTVGGEWRGKRRGVVLEKGSSEECWGRGCS